MASRWMTVWWRGDCLQRRFRQALHKKSIGAHCRKPIVGIFLYPLRDIKAWEQPAVSQEGLGVCSLCSQEVP
jgi:hypothetical protein